MSVEMKEREGSVMVMVDKTKPIIWEKHPGSLKTITTRALQPTQFLTLETSHKRYRWVTKIKSTSMMANLSWWWRTSGIQSIKKLSKWINCGLEGHTTQFELRCGLWMKCSVSNIEPAMLKNRLLGHNNFSQIHSRIQQKICRQNLSFVRFKN